ncbi:MAG: response regulator [Hyphomicrobiaceae bacterium]|nr:response regulator [Hyphomicrobiaceae bacterium]
MSTNSGGDFLAKKSDVTRRGKSLPPISTVLIVEDETFDADRLRATLRLALGYEVDVRRAQTLGSAVDMVLAHVPDLVFLDDILKPSDTAVNSIPYIRRANYTGPLIVISGQATRSRKAELIGLGASEVIHKDDVDSVRLKEALLRAFGVV